MLYRFSFNLIEYNYGHPNQTPQQRTLFPCKRCLHAVEVPLAFSLPYTVVRNVYTQIPRNPTHGRVLYTASASMRRTNFCLTYYCMIHTHTYVRTTVHATLLTDSSSASSSFSHSNGHHLALARGFSFNFTLSRSTFSSAAAHTSYAAQGSA